MPFSKGRRRQRGREAAEDGRARRLMTKGEESGGEGQLRGVSILCNRSCWPCGSAYIQPRPKPCLTQIRGSEWACEIFGEGSEASWTRPCLWPVARETLTVNAGGSLCQCMPCPAATQKNLLKSWGTGPLTVWANQYRLISSCLIQERNSPEQEVFLVASAEESRACVQFEQSRSDVRREHSDRGKARRGEAGATMRRRQQGSGGT